MSDAWTWRPSDFLMFSAGSWERLLELYNRETWPLHLAMLLLGLALCVVLAPSARRLAGPAALALAVAWAWVGWGFHAMQFAQINLAAPYLAWTFTAQAGLLAWVAAAGTDPRVRAFPRTGMALVLAALALWPLLAPLTGRGWLQAQVFGMAPDPTALATLGFLIGTGLRRRAWALPLPVLSLALGVATLWLLYA